MNVLRRAMAALLLMAGTLSLIAGPAAAGEIWQIGVEDDSRLEFYPDGGGALLAGCPFDGAGNTGEGEYVIGTNVDGDFPQFFETSDATSTFWRSRSCRNVDIRFTLDTGCANPVLTYRRFGGEIIDVLLDDEVVLDDTQVALNTGQTFVADIGGILKPGDHTVRIETVSRGNDDGYAATDFIKFECDVLVGYAKVSGRVDDPLMAGRRGRGAPLYTFSGFLGLTESGETVGSVSVNYKAIGDVCDFTGGDLAFPEPGKAYYAGADRSCSSSMAGTADLAIYDRSWPQDELYCRNANGRGCLGVSDGPGDLNSPYRVSESLADGSGATGGAFQSYSADIDAGNGIVMAPTRQAR